MEGIPPKMEPHLGKSKGPIFGQISNKPSLTYPNWYFSVFAWNFWYFTSFFFCVGGGGVWGGGGDQLGWIDF